ncbi:MAG: hypothetical protein JXB49_06105 [Bacteroidales bacterium]|nr:hypothetical protein [Bacteroidales bacterium]
MSSIFVILQKKDIIDLPLIVDMAMMEMGFDNSSYSHPLVIENIGFGCRLSNDTPESKNEQMPYLDTSSGCCIVADARIDYRSELIKQLGLNVCNSHELPDGRLLLLSYQRWGDECVKYLYGDFAFIIWDRSKRRLFCARDHFGCRPLYYISNMDYLAIATNLKAFNALPNFVYQINDQFILDAICSIIPNEQVQSYLGINRLQPAHVLTYSPKGHVQLNRYWDLRIQEKFSRISEKEAEIKLKDLFINAIRERSRSISPIGLELSGGLDSSSIASCINMVIDPKTPIYALSHTLDMDQHVRSVAYKEEYRYGSKVVVGNQIREHFLVDGKIGEGSYSAIINYLIIMMRPAIQSFALMSDLLYAHAKEFKIKVLFSGFGGDEGITYQGGGLLEELMQKKDIDKLKEILKIRIRKNGGNYFRQFIILYLKRWVPGLMQLLRRDWRRSRFQIFAINKGLGNRFRMRRRYFAKVQIPSDPDVRKRQYKRVMHPHIADRLENSYFIAKTKGVEYRYPFLDVKLIEFFYSIPSEYKYKNGTGRYLFRMAMKGILPEEIRLREDKTGATIPNVMYRIVKDEEIFRELIEEGRKYNNFHYVDYDKLHRMLDQFKPEEKRRKMNFAPRAFLSPMSVLILQKWQREGKINIGIKC